MNDRKSYLFPILVSVALHGLLVAVLSFGWEATSKPTPRTMPKFVEAKLVTVEPKVKQKKAPRKKVDLEKRRQEQAARKKREEAEKRRKAAVARKKKQEAERKKKEEQERKRREDEARKKKREEELRKQRASAFEDALLEEEDLLDAEEDLVQSTSIMASIERRITENWSRPPSARNGMQTILNIQLVPTGRVTAVNVVKSSGNSAFDRSAQQAVKKVESFPEVAKLARENPGLFERNFRSLNLNFQPEDLRQ
ncbi:cell envelope integrity protein TolA [Biformimicrobium ophioploci]|uniref:Protein TolA n=1 Tax=Biformimicrobium ophioploci TaxID=3036711 RepID=A0ABQ6LYT5_9GAMM|nr:cell envelope integrity protein TolA [Microbulbifer sp. NKW57]GMG87253.1 hypothetical protein MNKW57_15740 [Microbulbifer sp. NKW57]